MTSMRPISLLRRSQDSGSEKPFTSNKIAGMNGGRGGRGIVCPTKWKGRYGYHKTLLDPDGSAALRDQLLTELRSPDLGRRCRYVGAPDHGGKKQPGRSRCAARRRRICGKNNNSRKRRCRGDRRATYRRSETSQPRLPQNPHAAKAVHASTRACSRYRSRVGFGTRPTSNSWPNNPA